jgi:hypothetical protein
MSQQAPHGQEGNDEESGPPSEITWVGQQWRMDGYCGRAAQAPAPPAVEVRPVAVVRTRRSQAKVVRIGPPRELPAA